MPESTDTNLETIAPAFVDMAHAIVWATVATVDAKNRPRTRVLHPLWSYSDGELTGVIPTGPTPAKVADLEHSPFLSVGYWAPNQDVCRADCSIAWATDDASCEAAWEAMKNAPEPVGYDPALIPPWADGPTTPAFAVLKLTPHRLRVFPGTVMTAGSGELMTWSA